MSLRNMCSLLSIEPKREWVFAVELFPNGPIAPFRPPVVVLPGCRINVVEQVDVGVPRHGRQLLLGGPRVPGVRMAPPEHRLHALQGREPPMVSKDGPELGVHASLYLVVGVWERPGLRELGVEEGEQRPRGDQRRERPPRLPEPLVRIHPLSLDERSVLQEVRPEAAPVEIALAPQLRLVQRLDVREVEGDLIQLPSRLELRPRRRAPLDLGVSMEQASLHLGPGPGRAHGLGEAAAAVGDHDVGRRYRLHERRPRPRVLGLRHVPRDHPILAAADQHDQALREPDPVDEEDPVELAVGHRHGPDLPEPCGPAPEGPASAGHLELRVLRQKPRQELVEAGGGVVVAHGGRCAAGGASPSLRPRGGSAVPLRRTAAVRAFDRLHGATSSDERFNVSEKGYPPGATTVARTHILSECLKRAHEFKQAKKRHRPAPMPLMRTHILSYKPKFASEALFVWWESGTVPIFPVRYILFFS